MCSIDFIYVCIGERRMILCKNKGDHLKEVGNAIKKAFPELFTFDRVSLLSFFLNKFTRFAQCPEKIKTEDRRKMCSSQFDCQIIPLEKENDWNEIPFVALNLKEVGGETFCIATPIEV